MHTICEPLSEVDRHRNSHASKFSSFQYFCMTFFPVKAEMLYFSNLYKGDHKGDHLRIYFGLKKLTKMKKYRNFDNFKVK